MGTPLGKKDNLKDVLKGMLKGVPLKGNKRDNPRARPWGVKICP